MRELEARYMKETGTPSIELMERAATGVCDEIEQRLDGCAGHAVYFACGPGGNGGDGYAAARLFASRGGKSVVISISDESSLSSDTLTNCVRAHDTPRVFFHDMAEIDSLPPPDMWVDAMFGIGLNKALEAGASAIAMRMQHDRALGAIVLAVDIPSGLSGQTGELLGTGVQADLSVTFECPKFGHVLLDGLDQVGELLTVSIGIPHEMLDGNVALRPDLDDLIPHFPSRARNSHKGTYGHVLLIAGSRGMAGAALIAAMAALRSGVGLVTVLCPESVLPILQVGEPCAMCVPLPEQDGVISSDALPIVEKLLMGKSAVVIGPGLGKAPPEIVECVLCSGLPALLDADALNIMSENAQLMGLLRSHHLITPHPGEAARLLGHACTDPVQDALALHALGCTALLKGATSVIAGDEVHLSSSGCPGMAKGGSGDALSGVCGALMAQGFDTELAAWLGSELHGRAGENAGAQLGDRSMTAMDLVHQLKEAFRLVW